MVPTVYFRVQQHSHREMTAVTTVAVEFIEGKVVDECSARTGYFAIISLRKYTDTFTSKEMIIRRDIYTAQIVRDIRQVHSLLSTLLRFLISFFGECSASHIRTS